MQNLSQSSWFQMRDYSTRLEHRNRKRCTEEGRKDSSILPGSPIAQAPAPKSWERSPPHQSSSWGKESQMSIQLLCWPRLQACPSEPQCQAGPRRPGLQACTSGPQHKASRVNIGFRPASVPGQPLGTRGGERPVHENYKTLLEKVKNYKSMERYPMFMA